MSTLTIIARYRPLRIGWCVRTGSMEDVRKVIRLTCTLWGGRYNPIIPIGPESSARQLISTFRVDTLYPASDDAELAEFVNRFPYLLWPDHVRRLFVEDERGKAPTLLDIQHPISIHYEPYTLGRQSLTSRPVLYTWAVDDLLADIFLAYFGFYPDKETTGIDYARLVREYADASYGAIRPGESVSGDVFMSQTPLGITAIDLQRDRLPDTYNRGLYVGSANDFDDIVNFWNLRAADIDLIFYDPAHKNRLEQLKEAYLRELREAPQDPDRWYDQIAIWSKFDRTGINGSGYGPNTILCNAAGIWNGLNVKPPLMGFEEKSSLGSVSFDASRPSVSFQLPQKPFYDRGGVSIQKAVVSVRPLVGSSNKEETFWTPFIPELNEYYGREVCGRWNTARAEVDGLGIVTYVSTDNLALHSLNSRHLVSKIFSAFEMAAEPSDKGLVTMRLIQQMGGIQGCRVFKIPGVRKLIQDHGPLDSFTRSNAVVTIGQNDPATRRPDFLAYEDLFIEPRGAPKLRPEDAFTYLLKKGVFHAGLDLRCPSCELSFWIQLDDLATEVPCEYCRARFNITPQLRDRDWAYRPSGLFGTADNQQGGITVALTIQQLDTILHTVPTIFVTETNVRHPSGKFRPCETDFIVVTRGYRGRVNIAIGECKTRLEITDEDVANLTAMADMFPPERFQVFIVFSKATSFTDQEVTRCRRAQGRHERRVIMLSDRELEPYLVYERTEKEFDISSTVICLEDLAQATHFIYFDPRPKAQQRSGKN